MISPRRFTLVVLAAFAGVAACGGKIEREHTATTVRGSYGDPAPDPICSEPDDAGPTDASSDGGC